MPVLAQFCGGSYEDLSVAFAADVCLNLYAVSRQAEGSAKQKVLYGTPGLKPYATGSGAGCRGWYSINGKTWTVIGTNLYEVNTTTAVLTLLGTIADNGEPVSFSSNGQGGNDLAIVGGDELKILDTVTNVLSAAIALPFTGPVMVIFLDGYFLINQRDSPIIWFSALEDGTTWDALDFIARSGTADILIGLGVSQNRIWAFGTQTTTLFYDSGDADTPFLPYPGSVVQVGAITPWAITQRTDVFTWLATDASATPRVVKATGGPQPTTVSTPPIERWLRECTDLSSAEALTYQQDGHAFFLLTCPDSIDDIQTYGWDDTEGLWHARSGWDSTTGRDTRWRARGCTVVGTTVFVGDYATAALSTLDLGTYTDTAEGVVRWVRRLPYLSEDPGFIFVDEIELLAEMGVGLATGQGVDPVVYHRISRDAGKTWVAAGSARLGELGAYVTRAIWRRVGRVRADRLVIEVSGSDPVKRALTGMALRVTQGRAA